MWNQWSQYGAGQPPLPMAAAPPPPPAEPSQSVPPPQPAPLQSAPLQSAPLQSAALQPAMIGPMEPAPPAAASTAAPPAPSGAPANASSSNPYSQYTAAQYAALTPEQQYSLQQHWQQWQKYQEEYAKWHAQYGEQYKREMEAATTTPAAPYPAAPYATALPPSDTKAVGKITGQPQLYTQPPPVVGPTNQFPTVSPAPISQQQQQHPPPLPPPPQQQSSQQYQQQPPPQWQSNTSFYNQPPPNFNPSAAPPNNFPKFNNANTAPQNTYSSAPPPQGGGQMTQPPSFDSQRGNDRGGQAGNTNFNIGSNNTGPPPSNWNTGPNNRDNFGPNNNNRGRGPNNDNDQYGRRSGPPNLPGNQGFNNWNDGPNNRGNHGPNNGPNDWQQRGPNNRGNCGPNDWSQGPNNRGNRGPDEWPDVASRPDTDRPENWDDDAENAPTAVGKDGVDLQEVSFNRDSNEGRQEWQGGPNNRDINRNNDWNNPGNRSNNWNDGPNNRGRNANRNEGRNSRDRNRGVNYSREGEDERGSDGRNSRGSIDLTRSSLNTRDDEYRDGSNRYGARSDGSNNRFNNRSNDWSDNRGNNNRQWNDNRGQNNLGNNDHNAGAANNRGNLGPSNNAGASGRSNAPDIDEEMFDRQFKQWEAQFEDWKRANANHPDREMYDRYEKEFEKQRKRITERREQMRRRKMEQMGLDPNQPVPPPQPPNSGIYIPPPAGSDMNVKNTSRESSRSRRETSQNRGNTSCTENDPNPSNFKAAEPTDDVVENKAAIQIPESDVIDDIEDNSKTAIPSSTQQSSNMNAQKSTPLGKRKSRFDNTPPVNKMRPTTTTVDMAEVITLDDDDEDHDDHCPENIRGSKDHMSEIFKKTDGIPGLDLVEGASLGETPADVKKETESKTETQQTLTKKIPSLFDIKIKKPDMIDNVDKSKEPTVPVAEISKSLNDPEFMKKISEAVAKAQGKDDRQTQQKPQDMREWQNRQNCEPPNAENDETSNDLLSVKSGVEENMSNPMEGEDSQIDPNNSDNNMGGQIRNFGPNGPNNWGPNNEPNNWGQNNAGPNNWGSNNAGPNNWGPNSGGPNNWGPNNGGPNNSWGPNNGGRNNFGPNNSGPNSWGPNNRGGNNWGPNGGGPNNWRPNNNGPNNWGPNSGGPNNNWGSNNEGRSNNSGPNSNNSDGPNNWGRNNGGGPWGSNNNSGGPKNWGPNGPNNNFGPNFRGNNNNRNFGPNGPNDSNFGQNDSNFGPNGPDGPNFGARGNSNPNNRNFRPNNANNFGSNAPVQNVGSQNQSDLDQSQQSDKQARNSNNPFRRSECGGGDNQGPQENSNNTPRSPWLKGAGDNLDYGDYYRPVQVIDYANNANVAPKVIEYGHKPVVSDDFKPVKVINYDHVTKVGKRVSLPPLDRQRRGQKRRNRRKQQREERFNQSGLANATLNEQGYVANTTGDKEEQLEDISDTDDLPNDIDEKAESPAPPPPPMFSSGRRDDVFVPSLPTNSSIFPSTAEANDNIAKVEVNHVQMSIPTEENNNTISIEEILMQPGRETRPKKICIILRGPPGSGKSHVAKLIKDREKEMSGNNPRVLSIDDYFLIENDYEEKCPKTGKKLPKKEILYEFDKDMEETYMLYLIKSFKKTIADNFYDFIVIDCNNNSLRTLNEFYCHSKDSGYVPYIVDLFCDLETCMDHNVHSRTESEIKHIIATWKPTPFHYIKLDVSSLLQNIVEMEDADDMAVDENTVSEPADALSQTDENDKEATAEDNTNIEVNETDADADAFDEDEAVAEEDSNDSTENFGGFLKSKWETDTTVDNLARLDGTSRLNTKRKTTMEEYLQLDDWQPPASSNVKGKKRVRWADIEEKREQEKMRAVGFVVGQTDWKRMMDPNAARRALNKTKYIERVGNNKRR